MALIFNVVTRPAKIVDVKHFGFGYAENSPPAELALREILPLVNPQIAILAL